MNAPPADLDALASLMRRHGLVRLRWGSIEMVMGPPPNDAPAPIVDMKAIERELSRQDEAMQFAATRGFPDEKDADE